ncbi:hypothetical protein CGMCC3_g9077 [Colletotrichum fructicola]|nr:uncharacterized protein CGMCC3_g9077 [Colletotrichum fructicola]KAE9574950.1 hypothetical protein CGMCC3_g9077 [Colletotrichum fructicola]
MPSLHRFASPKETVHRVRPTDIGPDLALALTIWHWRK